jgi:cysteine synthase
MKERQREIHALSPERENLFKKAEKELQHPVEAYRLGDRFEGLPQNLAKITLLDVTKIPGCHYGAKNVFVPIIRHLEERGTSPETSILVEPSTGNGWVAFSDAAEMLGYEHVIIMPDGLPEARYRHPQGRKVMIIKTPKEEYALGMPKMLRKLIYQNKERILSGQKLYISPDHSVGNGEITVKTMSDIGRQLINNVASSEPLAVIASMGNGSSLCAISEYLKNHRSNAKIIATEDFAYGVGYDNFGKLNGYIPYKELFGIEPGNKELMDKFTAYGTNAPIGIKMPLQEKAVKDKLIDSYFLFTDNAVLEAYKRLNPNEGNLKNALNTLLLPNRDNLPQILSENYGNSTLGNIAVASLLTGIGRRVVALAYDSRKNY